MKRFLLATLFLVPVFTVFAQQNLLRNTSRENDRVLQLKTLGTQNLMVRPKLVVGIVVDQMRYDYLTRFWAHYGEGGFKRLVNEGFNCKNNHFNYVPTYTGPGHASVYTGTTPANHGIIGNNWFDKGTGKMVYCAEDESYNSVGSSSEAGKMSPSRMMTTTVTDELRLATQKRAKVIGIALKDRGAILPAGHMADAAYWFEGLAHGKWITSDYYMTNLPDWVKAFNASGKAKSYLKDWDTMYDIKTYVESGPDDTSFEMPFNGEKRPVFPHRLGKLSKDNKEFDIIKNSPFGNSLTLDFALAAIEGEKLGDDEITDFLAISFSSTDYIGHKFGVNSKEVQDTYIRLDKDLEKLLTTLDNKLGEGEYTVFLTADHGAVDVPAYLESVKIPSGYVDTRAFEKRLSEHLEKIYGVPGLVLKVYNDQVFLDRAKIRENTLVYTEIQKKVLEALTQYEGVISAYTAQELISGNYTLPFQSLLQKGFHFQRSGDVVFVLHPATISYYKTGSTHGSGFSYDTHVPLLFFGKGINSGSTVSRTEIPDIAPTISALLGIAFPNATTGNPIEGILE
ncbi:alkaline phosphatase PafA [Ascidiimonas aurantiaca]|uniref:alkaline phosphatase PafA n=1 Tax=Ascidiimonas aurantiaca TaxID=1685432 RepID=UPI0030ED6C62